jgi:putative peptide zinc metalloprotease protein
MDSQHSDDGTNGGRQPAAGFPPRILVMAAAAALLSGLAAVWWPDGQAYGAVGWDDSGPSWVFPFDPPEDPEDDGNQALAMNTTDGSVDYSVEFALVWADDGGPVETRNEAYAFASCIGCTAVAVGFQVVLIEEQTHVIAPQNLSAAVNHNCSECNTYALANQLVLSLGGPLSDDSREQLSSLWCEIDEYGTDLEDVPLSEIQSRLEAYKQQIITIVQADPATTDGITTSPGPDAEPAAEQPAEAGTVIGADIQKP